MKRFMVVYQRTIAHVFEVEQFGLTRAERKSAVRKHTGTFQECEGYAHALVAMSAQVMSVWYNGDGNCAGQPWEHLNSGVPFFASMDPVNNRDDLVDDPPPDVPPVQFEVLIRVFNPANDPRVFSADVYVDGDRVFCSPGRVGIVPAIAEAAGNLIFDTNTESKLNSVKAAKRMSALAAQQQQGECSGDSNPGS